jgi:DNA-binding response OmpR family regulator
LVHGQVRLAGKRGAVSDHLRAGRGGIYSEHTGRKVHQRHGYQVFAADSGEAALDFLQTRKGGINLVLLDLGMPGMGGLNCLRELVKIDDSLRVLIASGYSVNGPVKEVLESGAGGYLAFAFRS